jgi:hypothetical protein
VSSPPFRATCREQSSHGHSKIAPSCERAGSSKTVRRQCGHFELERESVFSKETSSKERSVLREGGGIPSFGGRQGGDSGKGGAGVALPQESETRQRISRIQDTSPKFWTGPHSASPQAGGPKCSDSPYRPMPRGRMGFPTPAEESCCDSGSDSFQCGVGWFADRAENGDERKMLEISMPTDQYGSVRFTPALPPLSSISATALVDVRPFPRTWKAHTGPSLSPLRRTHVQAALCR